MRDIEEKFRRRLAEARAATTPAAKSCAPASEQPPPNQGPLDGDWLQALLAHPDLGPELQKQLEAPAQDRGNEDVPPLLRGWRRLR